MPPRRAFRLISLAIHLVVFAWAISISVLDVGPLPAPRVALAYQDLTVVRFADIALPAPRPESAAPPRATAAVPIDAPDALTPERTMSPGAPGVQGPTPIAGVIDGLPGVIDGLTAPPVVTPTPRAARASQTPVRVSSIQTPKKIVHVAPRYPEVAQAVHVQGVVVLEAVIDARGSVQSVSVVQSIPLLDQSAIDAVRQWRFTPTILNGEAVPIILTVTVNFTLANR
jgi:periplasmic protein TonB